MVNDRMYSVTNQCLSRLKASEIDQVLKMRMEYLFIRLKRHILSTADSVLPEDIKAIQNLTEEIVQASDKEKSTSELEKKIQGIIRV